MDRERFDEIIDEDRREMTGGTHELFSEKYVAKNYSYKPFLECPRCGEWKLAAHAREDREKESKGILRGSVEKWEITKRWWKCQNCEGEFEVE